MGNVAKKADIIMVQKVFPSWHEEGMAKEKNKLLTPILSRDFF